MTDANRPRGLFYGLAGAVLAVQAGLFYALPAPADRPLKTPLAMLPERLGDWQAVRDNPITNEVAAVLNADETLNRDYVNPVRNSSANLFIAYFGAQGVGRWPHSPQHCMPGAGWDQRSLSTAAIPVAGLKEPIRIRRFILAKGDQQVVVHYWYEFHDRVIATELLAKVYLVLDSIRYRRSDTSLVRVITAVPAPEALNASIDEGVRFVQACFSPVRQIID